MLARYGFSVSVGSLVTFGLLFVMVSMISVGGHPTKIIDPIELSPFVMVIPDPTIERNVDPPERPPETQPQSISRFRSSL